MAHPRQPDVGDDHGIHVDDQPLVVDAPEPGAAARARNAERLAEAHRIYRQLAQYDLAFETVVGLNLAFYRTFATPSSARLLAETGEMHRNPTKRTMDTGLFMYEIIEAGPHSPRAREVLRRINHMHRRWPIPQDEYTYTTAAFIAPTVRWIDRYGWRRTTAEEREAITLFYAEVGRLMGVHRVPTSYADAEAILDEHEKKHFAPSPEAASLMAATADVFALRFPRPLRPLSKRLLALTLDTALHDTLSVPAPHRWERLAFEAVIRLRRLILRYVPQARRRKPFFEPGKSGSDVYPHGYTLDDLGVQS